MSLFPSSQRRTSPEPLHSLPPSPSEEDLGWRAAWSHSDDELDRQSLSTTGGSQHSKGKGKATRHQSPSSAPYANGDTDAVSQWPNQSRGTEAYPPTTDEEADTRRVQENLRKWEIAERQRWKAARSSASMSMSSSMIANVARRATFWSFRASRPPADGGGRHHTLQTSEDSANLCDVATTPPPSAPPSPIPTPTRASEQLRTGLYPPTADPFSDSPGSSSSLFVNAQPITSDIGASSSVIEAEAPESTALSSSSSPHPTKGSKTVSAPAPLDLPKPRSPPPRTATPHASRPPEPFPRPDSRMSHTTAYDDEEEKPVQWWTEWLCGCSEGPDRGGDIQAGRTNPLE